ncbi:MAG: hypothetical protein FD138_3397, partial [Planctomycetota bacterium]
TLCLAPPQSRRPIARIKTDSEVFAVLAVLKELCSQERRSRFSVQCRVLFRRAVRTIRLPAWVSRPSGRAFGVSLLLHLILAACAAMSLVPGAEQFREIVFETEWIAPASGLEPAVEMTAMASAATVVSLDDILNTDLNRAIGAKGQANGAGLGSGRGQGVGVGRGDGKSFFGLATEGKSFVYVLDCSLSMNHPHDSEFKTRFRKMKMELANSLRQLKPEQEFFIIFFNHEAIPMPADRLVSAAPENQQHFLSWVDQVPAQGDTDPTAALSLALRLRPDVIYFLTDGCFSGPANEIVRSIQQSRTAINTFSFELWLTEKQKAGLELMRKKKASAAMTKLGESTYRQMREVLMAEQVLQGLAEHNGGKYFVIP